MRSAKPARTVPISQRCTSDQNGRVRAKGLINSREQLESLFTASETGIPSYQAAVAGMSS